MLILDICGKTLTQEDKELLKSPAVSGVILFDKNVESRNQVKNLCEEIKNTNPDTVITIDQEGGRVRRLRDGFVQLPPLAKLGKMYADNPNKALEYAHLCGLVMAQDMIKTNIDLSFAPVLDIDKNISSVIGNRAFSKNNKAIVELANQYILGMRKAGMSCVGKHFPGHGSVENDTHKQIAIDNRSEAEIIADDASVFMKLNKTVGLDAVMMSHVIYPKIDKNIAGFSKKIITTILKDSFKFNGLIISDDLMMSATDLVSGIETKVSLTIDAGCDSILICHSRDSSIKALEHINKTYSKDKINLHTKKTQLALKSKNHIKIDSYEWDIMVEKVESLNSY
jgi:beta-N-acetylhexosaminidase